MEQIRGSNKLVLTVTCLVCFWFSVGMSSDSDTLIKTYKSFNDGLVSSVQSISESEWDSLVIQSEVPVMVLFTADWCGPCRWLLPTLYVLDLDYKDQFKFYTVDIDKESSIAARNMVRAIPATLVFKGGYIVATYMGTDSRKLKQLVEQYK
ncbi:unnamed protein product [Arabidopsis halleri]